MINDHMLISEVPVLKRPLFFLCLSLTAVTYVTVGDIAQADPPLSPNASRAIVDSSTLVGKVMCGYQGWFNTPTDGAGRGWVHWPSDPAHCGIDLWPDIADYPASLRYPSNFHNSDGTVAELYSPQDAGSVDLHFKWMLDYGIDGVFLQRFKSAFSAKRSWVNLVMASPGWSSIYCLAPKLLGFVTLDRG